MLESIGIRQLRDKSSKLEDMAKRGQSFVLSKNGLPLFLSTPLESMLEEGQRRSVALTLFENGGISKNQAARLSGLDTLAFMRMASRAGVAVIDYDDDDDADIEGLPNVSRHC